MKGGRINRYNGSNNAITVTESTKSELGYKNGFVPYETDPPNFLLGKVKLSKGRFLIIGWKRSKPGFWVPIPLSVYDEEKDQTIPLEVD